MNDGFGAMRDFGLMDWRFCGVVMVSGCSALFGFGVVYTIGI